MYAVASHSPSISYPPSLEPIRDEVLRTLSRDSADHQRISRCRYKSRCQPTFCPLCCRQSGYEQKERILAVCDNVDPGRLRFATFKTKDVAPDEVREAAQTIMHAGRTALKRLGVSGYVCRLEASYEDWHDNVHTHAHAIVDSPSGGRGYITARSFENEWLEALPAYLHPSANAVHVAPVRDIEAAATYLTKSRFLRHSTARIVGLLGRMKGVQRIAFRGSLSG